jgi:type I restriction enzyme, S subunit
MRSGYKKLGKYIRLVSERNSDLSNQNLIGLSIEKKFIPSISNTIGTDMSTYRIIQNQQFAYSSVTSRNGDKITIALYEPQQDAIISQAYTVFEVIDKNELLPEYLMMWFRRPEFDRYARFMSHGSAREIFGWEEMCNTELPVPALDTQREIVKEYNTIVNRIKLNEQLCAKLEETAQAIYKHWFVDFEFPDENGNPYKSSGGEMGESSLGNLPKNWTVGIISDVVKITMGQSPKGDTYNVVGEGLPLINGPVEFDDYFPRRTKWTTTPTKKSMAGDLIVCVRGSTVGRFVKCDGIYCLGRGVCSFRARQSQHFVDLLYRAKFNELYALTTGSTFPNWDGETLSNFPIVVPDDKVMRVFDEKIEKLLGCLHHFHKENRTLKAVKDLLLSKLATIESHAYQV